jgi:hypothetical protein
MSVMITGNFPGMTKEMYDEMASALLPLLAQRPGFIAHAAWPVGGGWQVMDIFESEIEHDSWAAEVVGPAMPEGLRKMPPPKMTYQPLHNVMTV